MGWMLLEIESSNTYAVDFETKGLLEGARRRCFCSTLVPKDKDNVRIISVGVLCLVRVNKGHSFANKELENILVIF